MAQQQSHFVIRTKMADAFLVACREVTGKASKPTRKMVRHILTAEAKGVGVKFNSARAKKKPAETAVNMNSMQEAA